jgi:hypothetical protein
MVHDKKFSLIRPKVKPKKEILLTRIRGFGKAAYFIAIDSLIGR